jgi:hypothetical protein
MSLGGRTPMVRANGPSYRLQYEPRQHQDIAARIPTASVD